MGLRGGNDCVESTATLAAAELDSLRPAELKWGSSHRNSQEAVAVYSLGSSQARCARRWLSVHLPVTQELLPAPVGLRRPLPEHEDVGEEHRLGREADG